MSFNPAPHHPGCRATSQYVGPFPVTTTIHHPDCTNRNTDKDTRTR